MFQNTKERATFKSNISSGFYSLKRKPLIQTDLKIGQSNDKYEREADRVADAVMRMPDPQVQMQSSLEEEEEQLQMQPKQGIQIQKKQQVPELQRMCPRCRERARQGKALNCPDCEKKLQMTPAIQRQEDGQTYASPEISNQLQTSNGQGTPLSAGVQQEMAHKMDADFSEVNIHTDSKSHQLNRQLGARAFTHGNDIYFNKGEYNPNSQTGKRLLAHELTHVVQQQEHGIQPAIQKADLTSPRLAGNELFERVLDNQEVIELGDNGAEVRRIQQMLMDLGYSLPVYGTDGDFGSETQAAVRQFQIDHPPLARDGRVGFNTITELDRQFPAVTLPPNRTDPWTVDCILKILCPWNKHLVEDVMPSYNVKTFDSRSFPTETWDGTKWVKGTFNSGGYRSPSRNEIGLLNTTTCEEFAFIVYHEGWHAMQGSSLSTTTEKEEDAYISSEQWSIDIGIPGQTFNDTTTGNPAQDLRETDAAGNTVVDESAAERLVSQKYGGVSSVPGETVIARVGASEVRVRRRDGSEYVRPAQPGDRVRGSVTMTNLQDFDPANWDCSII